MAASAIKWSAYGTFTQIITNAEPANTALAVSSAVDNTTTHNTYADFELQVTHGTNPVGGGYYNLYILPAVDGTNYADGTDGSVMPPLTSRVGSFPVRAVTSAQRVVIRQVTLPPGKFIAVVENRSGQNASTDTLQLYYRPYDAEAQ